MNKMRILLDRVTKHARQAEGIHAGQNPLLKGRANGLRLVEKWIKELSLQQETIFVLYDDSNQSYKIKGIFTSYEKAIAAMPDSSYAIMEFEIDRLDNGVNC